MKKNRNIFEEEKTSTKISINGRITNDRELEQYCKSYRVRLAYYVLNRASMTSSNFKLEDAEEIANDGIMKKHRHDKKDFEKGLFDKVPYSIHKILKTGLIDFFKRSVTYKRGAKNLNEVVYSQDGEASLVKIKWASTPTSFSTPTGDDDGMTLEGMIADKSKPFFKNEEDAVGFYENLKSCLVMFFRQKLGFGAEVSHVFAMAEIFIVMMQRQIDDEKTQWWKEDHFGKETENTFGESKKEDDRISALALKHGLTESYIKNHFTHVESGYEKASNKFPFANKEIYHEFISWCKNWQNRKKSEVQDLILYAQEK